MDGVIALDMSKTRTGWAAYAPGYNNAAVGSFALGGPDTSDGEVFARLHRELGRLRQVHGFAHLYAEAPIDPRRCKSLRNVVISQGLSAHAKSFAAAKNLRTYMEIAPDQWRIDYIGRLDDAAAKASARRRKAGGDLSASATDELKRLTMERSRQLGFAPENFDESDAVGLLTYAILLRGQTPPWLAAEVLRAPLVLEGAR